MGIEFNGLPEESKNEFPAHLDKLDPGITLARRKANKTAQSLIRRSLLV
jgi:hypothetical protein